MPQRFATLRTQPAFYDEVRNVRVPMFDINPIFISRWSPRAMTGRRLATDEVLPLFEAARWAPSSYNSQFWRFVVCFRDDDAWPDYLALLSERNQRWARHAALLGIVTAGQTHPKTGRAAPSHQLDAGSAWMSLCLEGARRGLVVRGMEGFEYERARVVAAVPDDHDVLCMFAIGERGTPEVLDERQREQERPNQRIPLREIVYRGGFGRRFLGHDGDGR